MLQTSLAVLLLDHFKFNYIFASSPYNNEERLHSRIFEDLIPFSYLTALRHPRMIFFLMFPLSLLF